VTTKVREHALELCLEVGAVPELSKPRRLFRSACASSRFALGLRIDFAPKSRRLDAQRARSSTNGDLGRSPGKHGIAGLARRLEVRPCGKRGLAALERNITQ
jgi:hypothetical protein